VAWASSPRMDHQPSGTRPHGGQDAHRTMGSSVTGPAPATATATGTASTPAAASSAGARCGHGSRIRYPATGSVTDEAAPEHHDSQRPPQGQRQRQPPSERAARHTPSRGPSWWPNGPRVPPSCAGGPYCQPPALSGPKGPAIPMARAAGRAHWCDPLASSLKVTWVEKHGRQGQRQGQRQRQGTASAVFDGADQLPPTTSDQSPVPFSKPSTKTACTGGGAVREMTCWEASESVVLLTSRRMV
jgi:hypothetical protein